MPKTLTFAALFCSATALAAGAFLFSASTAGTACAAGLGCCMEREKKQNSPWVQIKDATIATCKDKNREVDGEDDKILKPEGLIMWSIKC